MKADLIGWYAAGCSISGLTVYVGLHGSTYNPHVAELCTLVVRPWSLVLGSGTGAPVGATL